MHLDQVHEAAAVLQVYLDELVSCKAAICKFHCSASTIDESCEIFSTSLNCFQDYQWPNSVLADAFLRSRM